MAVALYARVSTTKQAEKDLSIPDQLRQMRDWCKKQGFALAVEYTLNPVPLPPMTEGWFPSK